MIQRSERVFRRHSLNAVGRSSSSMNSSGGTDGIELFGKNSELRKKYAGQRWEADESHSVTSSTRDRN